MLVAIVTLREIFDSKFTVMVAKFFTIVPFYQNFVWVHTTHGENLTIFFRNTEQKRRYVLCKPGKLYICLNLRECLTA